MGENYAENILPDIRAQESTGEGRVLIHVPDPEEGNPS